MIEIIPAIDLIDGNCVRLQQGDFSKQTIYSKNPLDTAKKFEDMGFRRLHLVDLDGAKHQSGTNRKILAKIAANTNLKIDFGGGIRTTEDVTEIFDAGAEQVTCGSVAATKPELFLNWLEKFGGERFILAADSKDEQLVTHGWKKKNELSVLAFLAKFVDAEKPIKEVLCTDVSRDGMLGGTALALYAKIKVRFPSLHLIASGGVGKIEDIRMLDEAKIPAVVVGKAFYEGKISPAALAPYLP